MEEKIITMKAPELDALLTEKEKAGYNEGYVKATEEAKANTGLAISVGADRSDALKLGKFLHNFAKAGSSKSSSNSFKMNWDERGVNAVQKDIFIKSLGPDVPNAGGTYLPMDFASEIIPALQPFSAVRSTGVRVDPLATGRKTYPANTSGSTAYWVGAGTNATASQPVTGAIQMATKKLVSLIPVQNELLRYNGDVAFQSMQDDALRAVAAAEDKAFLVGTGTDGAPKGLLNWAANSNNMTGGDTTALRRKDLIKAAGLVRRANVPVLDPVVFMNGRTYYDLWAAVDANSNPAFERYLLAGNLFGYKIVVTESIPIDTAGTYVIFADMGQAVIGQGVSAEVEFIPNAAYYNGSAVVAGTSTDESVIRVVTEVDFMIRYTSAASVIKQVTWGA